MLTYGNRKRILEEAKTWEHVRWKHQGRSRKGIDCVGLLVLVARGCGLEIYDSTDYPRTAKYDSLVNVFRQHFKEKLLSERQPGDIALFRDGTDSCHSGIISVLYGKESLIHAFAPRKKVVHELLLADMRKTMTYVFEFPEFK